MATNDNFAQQRGVIPITNTTTPDTTSNISPNVGAEPEFQLPDVAGLAKQQQSNEDIWRAQMDVIASQLAQQQASAGLALADVGLGREQALFNQQTGERDIAQARDAGLEGANFNAQQRGIFNSGIRTENRQEVDRESNEALADLKKQTEFSLRSLANRAASIRQQMAAARNAVQAQQVQAEQQFLGVNQELVHSWAQTYGLTPEAMQGLLNQFMQAGLIPQRPSLGGGTRPL